MISIMTLLLKLTKTGDTVTNCGDFTNEFIYYNNYFIVYQRTIVPVKPIAEKIS